MPTGLYVLTLTGCGYHHQLLERLNLVRYDPRTHVLHQQSHALAERVTTCN